MTCPLDVVLRRVREEERKVHRILRITELRDVAAAVVPQRIGLRHFRHRDAEQIRSLVHDRGDEQSSVRRAMDPEPLIALWPLWLRDAEGGGRPSSASEPGVPVRRVPQRAKPKAPAAEPTPETPAAVAPTEPVETLPSQ